MGVTVGANQLSVVHKKSSGITITFPDVCKTPTPGGPVPIPYPNIARSAKTAKGSKKVKADGQSMCLKTSNFSSSNGDEPGVAKGVVSSKVRDKAEFVMTSMDVKVEGKGVARAFDLMYHNQKNTPPTPVIQKPIISIPKPTKMVCLVCNKAF